MGQLIGEVKTLWLEDGRKMRLLEPFRYDQDGGVEWDAPRGSTIDGASIPKPLWSIVGGPYEGKYRRASVVHDVACDAKTRPWRQTHRAFYDAMRDDGTGRVRALLMYAAVYHFGPRWGDPRVERALAQEPERMREDAMRLRQFVEDYAPTLEQIEELDRNDLLRMEPDIREEAHFAPLGND